MNAPIVEFIVTGDEVMRGIIADTNTAMTASRLYPLGFALRRTTVVGDREEDIRAALVETSRRADFCIVSGGLGPTSDDLTAACAAQAAGVPMRRHEPWIAHLHQRWRRSAPTSRFRRTTCARPRCPRPRKCSATPTAAHRRSRCGSSAASSSSCPACPASTTASSRRW
ncbi:MAG: hypothetical protein E6J88_07835 [Deltaproteobacteria bacterium]|nr:MAG: hypothetical protein E6J88_07835 [Deltaproteobacteria bacterium]